MKRRSKVTGEPIKGRRRKTPGPKHRNAPKVVARSNSSPSEKETEVARLARELRQRTTDLDEALEQQRATADILRVISSSPSEIQPVLEAIVQTAAELCAAEYSILFRLRDGKYHVACSNKAGTEFVKFSEEHPIDADRRSLVGRTALERRWVHIEDCLADPDYGLHEAARIGKHRTMLGVPLLHDGVVIGVIGLLRTSVKPFTDKQIELVTTFASQADIAIENARLLNELHQRTSDLAEALEQQTATSEVLQVISGSPGDLQPVFAAMLENAARICDANFGNIFRWDGDALWLVATHNTPPAFIEHRRRVPFRPNQGNPIGDMLKASAAIHVADLARDQRYIQKRDPEVIAAVELGGIRTFVAVPMLKDDKLIGTVILYRQEVRPFSDKQIELVKNFAAQAVIAIENARLLNELRQRTDDLTERTADLTDALEQQTATSEVLQVISSSSGDLEPVFATMLEKAVSICDAKYGNIYRWDGEFLHLLAAHDTPPALAEFRRRSALRPSLIRRMVETKTAIHVIDVAADPEYLERRTPSTVAAVELGGVRSFLSVPMLKENELIGSFSLYRQEVRPFTEKQIELVTTFADQAVIAIENARLLNELRESLEQQTATSEVLKAISSSPGDLQPVFAAMLENAVRICDAKFGNIYRWDGDAFNLVATHNTPPALAEGRRRSPMRPDPKAPAGRMVATKTAVHIADLAADPGYIEHRVPAIIAGVELGGIRTLVTVPMLKENKLVGALTVYRQEVRPFTDKQIELLTNFAAQAVIAIENTRLLNELRQRTTDLTESLEQQTATSEVLQVISSSPGDVEPVFQAMLENAVRICDATFGNIYRWDGENLHLVAANNTPGSFVQARARIGLHPGANDPVGRMIVTKAVVHTADLAAERDYIERRNPGIIAAVEVGGVRTLLAVPLLKDNQLIGSFHLSRQEVRPFTKKQITLVTNFAAQAVIAIENARLLTELHQRTTELTERTDDLTEALEQQTATSEVLQVISSSPGELQPVFDVILDKAVRICRADTATLFLYENGTVRRAARHSGVADATMSIVPSAKSGTMRSITTKQIIHIPNYFADPAYLEGDDYVVAGAERLGIRASLHVPMLREQEVVGAVTIWRKEARAFTEKQIDLIANFAAQAVIAIENTRLLNELRQRTDDLTESLEQQTATSKVLDVISRSVFDLHAVFETVAESSVRLCGADRAYIFRFDGEVLQAAAAFNASQEHQDFVKRNPIRPGQQSVAARAALERRTIHIPDVSADPEYTYGIRDIEAVRTVLGVPILKGDALLGVLIIYHLEVRPFTDNQIALVETFADQAAIAIENVRLLDALRHRTDELGRSVGELRALGEVSQAVNSTLDLETVLTTIVAKAVQLSGTEAGAIYVFDDRQREFHLRATYGMDQELIDALTHADRGVSEPNIALILAEHEPIQVADLNEEAPSELNEITLRAGYRARLVAPLIRGEDVVGLLVVRRRTPGAFPQNTADLIKTFAAQSAVAIANARLFQNIEVSLRDLRTAQDRLVQTEKLASLGQLTAGIAHEIQNPLNFVNNFSAVSVELIDELREALGGAHLNSKLRAEIGEIADTLQGNLDKVVQHGKRADAIVKNMLLHSRQGSGEHRPVDINALVDESLNLAYHGARAEKQGFTVTLERSFDPAAGEIDVFPQEITRALLNLISNGFYAATKRKAEANGGDYEPTLAAATKSLGDSVEIRIRDNGTGIPPEVKEKLFNPFFTTKPAGEGTGLGLSISHDIIVKQHGGSIEVDTQPGEFTEFRIVLPRAGASLIKSGERL